MPQTVYKIDTTVSGAASVVGAYAAKPSASAGNPVAFAVLSNGDAFVSSPVELLHVQLAHAVSELQCLT